MIPRSGPVNASCLAALLALVASPPSAAEEARYLDPPPSCEGSTLGECAEQLTEAIGKKGMIGLGLRCGAAPREGSSSGSEESVVFVAGLVVEGGAAAEAGLEQGDRIVAINGIRATAANIDELHRIDDVLYPGDRVRYTVLREGTEVEIEVVAVPINTEILRFQVNEELESIFGQEATWSYLAGRSAPSSARGHR